MSRGSNGYGPVWKILRAFAISAPAGTLINGVGITAVTIGNLPSVVYRAYRTVILTPRFGPVIKTAVAVGAVPIVAVAVVPTAAIASVIVGLGYGFGCGIKYGLGESITKCLDLVREYRNQLSEEHCDLLEKQWCAPLEEGEKPFDVPLVNGLRGVVSAVLVGPFEAVSVFGVGARHMPRILYELFKVLLHWPESLADLALMTTMSALAVPVCVLLVPLSAIASIGYGVVDTCAEGYTDGFTSAVKKAFKRVKDLDGILSQMKMKKR